MLAASWTSENGRKTDVTRKSSESVLAMYSRELPPTIDPGELHSCRAVHKKLPDNCRRDAPGDELRPKFGQQCTSRAKARPMLAEFHQSLETFDQSWPRLAKLWTTSEFCQNYPSSAKVWTTWTNVASTC